MTIKEYQKLAMRTSPPDHDRVMNGCMGLIGEVGKVVDIVKKWRFQSGKDTEFPTKKFIKKCGDILWYCAELATGIGKDLDYIYRSQGRKFYNDLHEINVHSTVDITVCRLSAISIRPFIHLYDEQPTLTLAELELCSQNAQIQYRIASLSAELVGIMVMIDEMLRIYCYAALHDAMERNIEKLRRRYPDRFDAESSPHRNEK